MRMRKKPNLAIRMERCAGMLVSDPAAMRGRWRELFPAAREVRLEIGCGKGRFSAETAEQNPDVLYIALERVPDAMIVAMERCQAKIGKLTATLADNAGSIAAKYIVNEIEKLDLEYNSLRKKMLAASADERRAAVQLKNAMEKREEINRLLENFENFSAAERNQIAKDVLTECVWDGETLFLKL